MTDYAVALEALHPGAEWTMDDNQYSTLVWLSEGTKPTKKSLDDAWPAIAHAAWVGAIQQQRQVRYRAEADPLYFEAARGEDGVTMADWEAKVAQIKAELPYPEAP